MITSEFSGILASIILEATKWASKRAKEKLVRNAQVIALLKTFGYKRLEDNFECIYAQCLATFAAEGKPRSLLDIYKEESVISAFRTSWRTGELSVFSKELKRAVEILSKGDQVKALGVDVSSEIIDFHIIFKEFVQKARSPGSQEIASVLSEVRDILKSPRMSPQLKGVLDALYRHCRSNNVLVTRAHLFHRLLNQKLECFRQPLLERIKNMLEDFSEKLKSDALTSKDCRITGGVDDVISLARSKAKEIGASEFGVERLLLILLDNPGENVSRGMSKHNVTRQEIISSIRQSSPDLF